jgi:HSP20 family protein
MAKKTKQEERPDKSSEEHFDGPATIPPKADLGAVFDQEGELVVDVFETNADFVVLAAIAGIQIKDLDISLEKDMMVIKGNRGDPHEDNDKKYFYQECYWGPFSRKIILPENVDIDKADAQMDKGVLTIKIPKNESNGKVGIKVS